jgi:hypothetical protein
MLQSSFFFVTAAAAAKSWGVLYPLLDAGKAWCTWVGYGVTKVGQPEKTYQGDTSFLFPV